MPDLDLGTDEGQTQKAQSGWDVEVTSAIFTLYVRTL
jgi:hypothetical protein